MEGKKRNQPLEPPTIKTRITHSKTHHGTRSDGTSIGVRRREGAGGDVAAARVGARDALGVGGGVEPAEDAVADLAVGRSGLDRGRGEDCGD